MISTYATRGAQRLVNSFEEAMAWFKAANFLDCRISAYPKYTDFYINRTGIAPSLLLVDIDREHFDTTEQFELCAAKTIKNFKELLDAQPTQLFTGNGYHFIQPQFAIILEKVERFKKFGHPSRDFMRFEEQLLTDNKADQSHSNNVSFGNCMLRVPNTLNSSQVRFNEEGEIIDISPEAEVRVIQHWDGNRPSIKPVLPQYYIWLQDVVTKDIDIQIEEVQNVRKYRKYNNRNRNTIGWIEKLLDTPLDDYRKFCIWRVFAPYLINVKRMSRSDAFNTIKSWLDKCSSVSRLNFNPTQKIDEEFNRVGSYYPVSRIKLEQENNSLYVRLEGEGIIQ